MTAFIALQAEVLSEIPQADVILIERSIRRAVRRFCRKTLVLRETTNPLINIVADQPEYEIPAVENREIVRIVRGGVWWRDSDPYPLSERSEDQFSRDHLSVRSGRVDGWKTAKADRPPYFYQPLPNRIRLVPIPISSAEERLEVTYALMPSLTATEVDDFVFDNWYEHIVTGALADLLAVRQKPWTDLNLAKQKDEDFKAAMETVVAERVSGFADNDYAVGRVRAYP